ncbi:Holliday junction branch migration protein RuvA [Faucicola boevrei]|uniref:Holliday junction branch migration protein RuvA n=1 Tax=Faucicola boevrei TaxID=346665 RepID=UPI000374EBCB|nr:Holliday junction branch migration protein RuvA [Moraxella boevrei]
MIAKIHGNVEHLHAPTAIIMTASGVGYEIEMPLNTFCQLQLNQPISLWTQLIVREDAHLLFGFLTYHERELFRQLLKINGVGAKMALAILSTLSLDELKHYVAQGDETALTRIPGVGKKTAQRLLVELVDKIKHLGNGEPIATTVLNVDSDNHSASASQEMHIIAEVEAGLMALGYKEKEAQQAIKIAKTNLNDELTTQHLLKLALKSLA